MRVAVLICVALTVLGAACSDEDDDADDNSTPSVAATAASPGPAPSTEALVPTPAPAVTTTMGAASPTPPLIPPVATPNFIDNGDVMGTFLEPGRTVIANTATLGEPVLPEFDAWDRQSVMLYDLQEGTAANFGPGFFAGFSGDGSRFALNNQGTFTVVEIGTGERQSFPVSRGFASLVGEHHAIVPSEDASLLDLLTGERSSLEQIDDPELRFLVEQRLRPTPGTPLNGDLVLRQADWNAVPCADTSEAGQQRCRAEAFEQWRVEELATGRVVLEFRALLAVPAGPGELAIYTSPQCQKPAGSRAWCEDVLAEWRPTLDRSSIQPQFAQGTANIFLVDIATGDATFVATAMHNPHAFIWPQNWPLIANEDFVIWTESYCGQPQGKTRIFDRQSGEITELDIAAWVRWHGDVVGIGEFSSRAIFDPSTLEFVAMAPEGITGAAWSPDLRYVGVGAVLGHGGLCG